MPTMINSLQLLSACVDLASHTGKLVRKFLASSETIQVDIKSDNSPATQVDNQVQELIWTGLKNIWKDLPIRGEEDVSISQDFAALKPRVDLFDSLPSITNKSIKEDEIDISRLCVWIDPLDGTKAFVRGDNDYVFCLIGICVDGRPIGGIMGRPVDPDLPNGRIVFGWPGLGVLQIQDPETPTKMIPFARASRSALKRPFEQPEFKSTRPPPKHELNPNGPVVVTSLSHSNTPTEAMISILEPSKIIRVPGAGFKAYLVLSGHADVYAFACAGTKFWDTAAPEALVSLYKEGRWTDCLGEKADYSYNVTDVRNFNGILAHFNTEKHVSWVEKIGETPWIKKQKQRTDYFSSKKNKICENLPDTESCEDETTTTIQS